MDSLLKVLSTYELFINLFSSVIFIGLAPESFQHMIPCAYASCDTTKLSISEVVAYLKGKSALMIFDNHPEFRGRWGERHMWACGHYVDIIGNVNDETTKNYIKEQNKDMFNISK